MKLQEIAKAANVSLTTVSLVLNGKKGVGDDKRTLIEEMLTANGYAIQQPKSDARLSRTIKFIKYVRHNFGIDGNPGFITQIIDAVERECRKNGFNLLMTSVENIIDMEATVKAQPLDGVIILGTELDNNDTGVLAKFDLPLVMVDNHLPLLPFNCVTMNNREAIFAAVNHLAGLGHKNIGFLENSVPVNNDRERRDAFEQALLYYGLKFKPSLIYALHPTMDGAYASMLKLLEKHTIFPSALCANNDSIAIGAMKAMKGNGISIPRDISIVGFDGIPFSAVSEPPLTTMAVPCEDIAMQAVRLLLNRIENPGAAVCKIRVNPILRKQASTAVCRHSES
ncbi:MAG: LacI family DNA-binding transcriptional regulator [Clostridiales bacterium]|jgi:LacI family transcriptional regulator|nr:LacI family DNA-binding transcriptional regulator [Clostridiales bacterium]